MESLQTHAGAAVEQVLAPTGALLWVDAETALDAVTAVSGSGPAYVCELIEAMVEAGVDMGLTPRQAHQLAVSTFTGASALAAASDEAPAVLRARVTSKGGTTHAAVAADVGTVITVRVPSRSRTYVLSVCADSSTNMAIALRYALDTSTKVARLIDRGT